MFIMFRTAGLSLSREVKLVPNDHMTYTVVMLSRKREVIEAWERIGRLG